MIPKTLSARQKNKVDANSWRHLVEILEIMERGEQITVDTIGWSASTRKVRMERQADGAVTIRTV